MRHEPFFVYGITRETTAEMIVNPAFAHSFKRMFDRFKEARVVRAQSGTPEHFQDNGLRKFRCATQAAISWIEHVADLHRSGVQLFQSDRHTSGGAGLVGEARE